MQIQLNISYFLLNILYILYFLTKQHRHTVLTFLACSCSSAVNIHSNKTKTYKCWSLIGWLLQRTYTLKKRNASGIRIHFPPFINFFKTHFWLLLQMCDLWTYSIKIAQFMLCITGHGLYHFCLLLLQICSKSLKIWYKWSLDRFYSNSTVQNFMVCIFRAVIVFKVSGRGLFYTKHHNSCTVESMQG